MITNPVSVTALRGFFYLHLVLVMSTGFQYVVITRPSYSNNIVQTDIETHHQNALSHVMTSFH